MKEERKLPTPAPREEALAVAAAVLATYEAAFRELAK